MFGVSARLSVPHHGFFFIVYIDGIGHDSHLFLNNLYSWAILVT